MDHEDGDDVDGLKAQVMSLPESIRSRFGEICWAQGGSGYGWWPSLIYDPRRAGEPARTQARRFLGSRFLVYFIECPESPFSLLDNSQIKPWIEGLSEDLHLGKSAKHGGKMKLLAFQRALLTATHLSEKPLEERLGYSNEDEDEPEMFARQTRSQRAKLVEGSPRSAFQPIRPATTSVGSPSVKRSLSFPQRDGSRRRVSNEGLHMPIASNAHMHEVSSDALEDDEMVCKIIMKASQGRKEKSIGIVLLPSIHTSTFAHIRAKIKEELCGDLLPGNLIWKFFLMEAGVPVSVKQEVRLGPVYKLLTRGRKDALSMGTLKDPMLVYISDKV